MRVSRRAAIAAAGTIGLGADSVAADDNDDIDLRYGAVSYSEQGYGGSAEECFIATAAIGTSDDEQVATLRRFRDGYLLKNQLGLAFVRLYYTTSPPIARWIARGSRRRWAVRTALIRPAAKLAMVLE